MPAQVKADRYQLVPLGGEGNIVVNGHSIARSVLVAAFILPTGKLIPGTAGVSSNGSGVAIFRLKIVVVAVVYTFGRRAAVQVIMEQVLPLFLALFGERFGMVAVVANLCAGAGTIQQMLVPFSPRPGAPVAGVVVGLVVLTIGVAVGQLFTGGENKFAIQLYIGTSAIAGSFAAETKYLRAGDLIPGGGNIGICNVQDVLVLAHVGIVDVQSGFVKRSSGGKISIYRAVVEIDGYIIFPGTKVGIYIDDFTFSIKSAAIKCHNRRAVCPKGIVACPTSGRRIKGGIFERGTRIAPVEGFTVDCAVVDNGIVCTDKAQIVNRTRAESHIFKSNGASTIKTIVTVILSAIISRVRNWGTDVPRGDIHTRTHKSQVFALCGFLTVNAIKGIVAFAQIKRVTALGFFGGRFEIFVKRATSAVPNPAYAQSISRGRGDSIRCSYFFFAFRRIRFAAIIRAAVVLPRGVLVRFVFVLLLGVLVRFVFVLLLGVLVRFVFVLPLGALIRVVFPLGALIRVVFVFLLGVLIRVVFVLPLGALIRVVFPLGALIRVVFVFLLGVLIRVVFVFLLGVLTHGGNPRLCLVGIHRQRCGAKREHQCQQTRENSSHFRVSFHCISGTSSQSVIRALPIPSFLILIKCTFAKVEKK